MLFNFAHALKHSDEMIISPDAKSAAHGHYFVGRVDRDTVPDGWNAYDIRGDGYGNFATVEESVVVNHEGTFLTKDVVKMNKRGFHSLQHGAGWTFV